jgi:hypothetical protein
MLFSLYVLELFPKEEAALGAFLLPEFPAAFSANCGKMRDECLI